MGGGGSKIRNLQCENPATTWQIISDLGSGTYGKVSLVREKTTNAMAAAKIAPIANEETLQDFATEIAILQSCKHPGITNFVSVYYFENNLWILIEACKGGSLSDILKKRKAGFLERQIKCAAFQMLEALDFLHSHSVIHRDLNASNTLLAEGGLVKIADFGVSAKNKAPGQRRTTFIGSPNWMAPEVVICENSKTVPYSSACDIWSFGITLIEFAEIKPPNSDLHPIKVLFKIASSPPPRLSAEEKWSATFCDFLRLVLIKDQFERPSAIDLLRHSFAKDQSQKEPLIELLNPEPPLPEPGRRVSAAAGRRTEEPPLLEPGRRVSAAAGRRAESGVSAPAVAPAEAALPPLPLPSRSVPKPADTSPSPQKPVRIIGTVIYG